MRRASSQGQDKLLNLDRGLFIIHYQSAEDGIEPPKVIVTPAAGSERDVELVLHPDADEGTLWQPDTKLVVRTAAPCSLQIHVLPLRAGGSHAATVKIEPVSHGERPALAIARTARTHGSKVKLDDFRLLGHVAGRGDVVVRPNEWVAGPTAPSRIEGIMLAWPDQPEDLDIRYAVKTIGPQIQPAKLVTIGTFSGTRGKALPISSVVLEMSGDGAADCHFVAEAVFLNSPTLRATGRRVVLSGPTGREPMVGLRINLESIEAPEIIPTNVSAPASKPAATSGRVRVFRSRPRQGTSAE